MFRYLRVTLLGASWTTFALFFLAPDLSWLGYLSGARVGAATYNSTHSYAHSGDGGQSIRAMTDSLGAKRRKLWG
jgi:hypothetical protein